MNILITGASGIIGKKLIDRMIKQNKDANIHVLLQKQNDNFNIPANINIVFGNILNSDSLDNATKNIDIVIHLAGITHTNKEQDYYNVNTLGTKNLLKSCKKNNVEKFIYISSRAACENGGAYSKSKLQAEKEVRKFQKNWIILSLAEVYGAGSKEMLSKITKLIINHRIALIIGRGNYFLAPVHVDDVINTIVHAVLNQTIYQKKYIIAGPEELSYNNIIEKISQTFNVKSIKIFIPISIIKIIVNIFSIFGLNFISKDQIPRLLCEKPTNIKSAQNDLNFSPRTFDKKSIKSIN